MYKYEKKVLKLVPPNFCLKNYAGGTECNTQKWEYNIHKRVRVQLFLHCIENGQEGIEETLRHNIDENLKEGFYDQIQKKETVEDEGTISFSPIIRQANIDHLKSLISSYEQYKSDNTHIDPKTPLDDFSFFSRNGGPLSIAAINIQTPEKVLIEEFKKWLKDVRKSLDVPEKKMVISDSKLRSWHASKVLPYIDLIHWLKLQKISFKDDDIVSILFPEKEAGLDGLRKTTRKHAREVLNRKTLYSLRSQN